MHGQLGHLCCRRRPGEWENGVSHNACNSVKLTAVAGSGHPKLKQAATPLRLTVNQTARPT